MSESDDLLREALLAQAMLAKKSLRTQPVDPMVPRADPVGYVAPEAEQGPTNLRGEFSQQGIDLARQASFQGGGVVDVPDEIAL